MFERRAQEYKVSPADLVDMVTELMIIWDVLVTISASDRSEAVVGLRSRQICFL